MIVDGHPAHRAHRARIVRDWIAANPTLSELHFPPGYAPELNPAEMLNCDVKANALGRRRPLDVTQLKADVRCYLPARPSTPPLAGRQALPRASRHLRRRDNHLTPEVRYLDDERFTEDRRTLDAWGDERIERRLAAAGVAPDTVAAALGDRAEGEARDAAVALLERRIRERPTSDRERERALGLLVRRGYDLDLAYEAVLAFERSG